MSFILDYIRGLSLRHKLLALVLGPLLLLTGTVILLTAQWSTSYTYKQLFAKVNTDLHVTHDVFNRIQQDRQTALTSLANSAALLSQLKIKDASGVLQLLGDHTRLAAHAAVRGIHRKHLVHALERHHYFLLVGDSATAQAGATTRGHQRKAMLIGQ